MISPLQAGIFINFFGFALDVIGLATVHWLENGYTNIGLFRYTKGSDSGTPLFGGRYKTMQYLSCLAFIVLLVATIMAAVFLCKATLRANAKYIKALGILMIIGGIIGFVGAMFGAGNSPSKASWSLGLAAAGSIVSGISGILVLLPSNVVTVS